jgi:hypothetical protein
MTQPSRTRESIHRDDESIHRDDESIRDLMDGIRELPVPDRATLARGLVGHLATTMNRSEMTTLLDELREQAARAQDVSPSRQGVGQEGRGAFRSAGLV